MRNTNQASQHRQKRMRPILLYAIVAGVTSVWTCEQSQAQVQINAQDEVMLRVVRQRGMLQREVDARLNMGMGGGRDSIHGRLDRDQLEELLYGTLGGSKQAFRRSTKELIQRNIDQIHQTCQLTDEQMAKVQSAVEIEIARWESRITALLSEITPTTEPAVKQTIFTQAWSKVMEYHNEPKVSESTVWYKTLMATLTLEQREKLLADQARTQVREWAVAKYRVLLLAQRAVGLTTEQRTALDSLLEKHFSEHPDALVTTLAKLQRLLQENPDQSIGLTDGQRARLKSSVEAREQAAMPDIPAVNLAVPARLMPVEILRPAR
ncbi:hypothetical protein SH449x_001502 [Pirellulaceae bacterium SH449]